ncbi:hypothetical protein PUN28_008602 [Cardiocondyla obscurior]|uniref:Ribosomal protein L2 n=1 Tax=Cardiocondyla obscurior TaxID=286306 RepID=A0AAW2FYC7_9HYME
MHVYIFFFVIKIKLIFFLIDRRRTLIALAVSFSRTGLRYRYRTHIDSLSLIIYVDRIDLISPAAVTYDISIPIIFLSLNNLHHIVTWRRKKLTWGSPSLGGTRPGAKGPFRASRAPFPWLRHRLIR